MLHRASVDKSNEILYLQPFIAITKTHVPNKLEQNEPDWGYALCKAHWLNEPELVECTGDTTETPLVDSLSEIQWVPSENIIYGSGHDPDADWQDSFRFFVVTHDRVLFFKTRSEMNNHLEQLDQKANGCVEAEQFFRKHTR